MNTQNPPPIVEKAAVDRRRMVRSERKLVEPWRGRARRHAWVGSMLLHTSILLAIAFLWRPITKGTGGEVDRPVGIALVHHHDSGVEYKLQGGGDSSDAAGQNPLQQNSNAAELAAANEAMITAQVDQLLGSLSAAMNGLSIDASAAGGTGAAGLSGEGSGGNSRGNAAPTKTSFLGIEGQGNSFVYVLDRSDSMSAYQNTPLVRAKAELARSIESLGRVNQFQIIFYNENPTPFRGSLSGTGGLVLATDIDKRSAEEYVRGIKAFGGTNHYPALAAGLRMSPDVLFFLTDANEPALTSDQLKRLLDLADRAGTTIHAIEFGVGSRASGGGWIADLAQRTRGKYSYIDVASFISNSP